MLAATIRNPSHGLMVCTEAGRVAKAGEQCVADPSPLYTGPTTRAVTIHWVAGEGVSMVRGATISTKDGGSFNGIQPNRLWGVLSWTDPEDSTATYEYTVSAQTDDGVRTLDPKIINTTRP